MLLSVTNDLSHMSNTEISNIGWHYYKNSCIINYTNNLRVTMYNYILYLLDIQTYLLNKERLDA